MKKHNAERNPKYEGTFLLPMAVAEGSPVHPAYPSGHAINVGAYITTLKVRSGQRYVIAGTPLVYVFGTTEA